MSSLFQWHTLARAAEGLRNDKRDAKTSGLAGKGCCLVKAPHVLVHVSHLWDAVTLLSCLTMVESCNSLSAEGAQPRQLFRGTKLPFNSRLGFQVPSCLEIGCGFHFVVIRCAVANVVAENYHFPLPFPLLGWSVLPWHGWGSAGLWWGAGGLGPDTDRGVLLKLVAAAKLTAQPQSERQEWTAQDFLNLLRSWICNRALTIATAWHASVGHETVNFHFSPSRRRHRGKKISVISVN